MTLAEKCRCLAALADQGKDEEVYQLMALALRMRDWPDWLKETANQVDFLCNRSDG